MKPVPLGRYCKLSVLRPTSSVPQPKSQGQDSGIIVCFYLSDTPDLGVFCEGGKTAVRTGLLGLSPLSLELPSYKFSPETEFAGTLILDF